MDAASATERTASSPVIAPAPIESSPSSLPSPASSESPPASSIVAASSPPRSVTSFAVSAVGVATMLVAFWALRRTPWMLDTKVLALVAAAALPIAALDLLVLRVHRRPSTGLDWDKPFAPDVARVATKLLGLAATVGVIALAYWLFPEYRASFYAPFFRLASRLARPLIVGAVFYVAIVDGVQRDPRDAYWQIGRALLLRFDDVRGADVASHARGWLVKAFFLPLMATYTVTDAGRFLSFSFDGSWTALRLYDFAYPFLFFVDVTFATLGYCLSLRVTDSHLRSAEPTMLGWVVAICCYAPFFPLLDRQYIGYDAGHGFWRWLAPWPRLRLAWLAIILALVVVYVLATISFGLRFSNLTHRGVLTNGPYRFTKHPAYVAKNLSWWMTAAPFALIDGVDLAQAIRLCALLLLVNTIYFLRARTEERHLSRDPAYVAYATWMNDHGLLRGLGRLVPALRYRAPAAITEPPDTRASRTPPPSATR